MNLNADSLWPEGKRFALFLSHDVDEVYDRELFRILGDINHIRRVIMDGEPGSAKLALNRVGNAILRPRNPLVQIERILEIERKHAFRSTFFMLEDQTFNRHGGRYRYSDPAVQAIARRIIDSGCELAVHGAYHNFNDSARYRDQFNTFKKAFGIDAAGIRNHYLRHDGLATWKAQHLAGFKYGSSFGFNERIGVRDGCMHPFYPMMRYDKNADFVVIPLTIQDWAMFHEMRLSPREALDMCKMLTDQIVARGGCLALLWHNNYFHEPEFADWEMAYIELLDWLVAKNPWNATGAEIAAWWARSGSGV